MRPDVVVAGQLARDLVVVVDQVPGPEESGTVRERREMLGGKGANQAELLAAEILRQGPRLVALAVGDEGNYFAWPDGEILLPLTRTTVADTTGAGDALITGLARGHDPEHAARLAVAAAGATVGHPGGRPDLTEAALDRQLELLAGS
jgi:ribokinase